jgi:hypothetical protein
MIDLKSFIFVTPLIIAAKDESEIPQLLNRIRFIIEESILGAAPASALHTPSGTV